MTTFRNTEYLILVAHDEAGNEQFAHGQVSRVQIAPDGTRFPAPPLDFEHTELGPLLADFNNDLLQQNAALAAQVEPLTQQVSELNAQVADLNAQLLAAREGTPE